uniref:Uncharacterized protein n=1 Tax=Marseillevirus LCMAC103 TaxID=2506604 RepID=A0A481YUN6_9VIRU|nr:MAG: hypothetical protein LCMAC103_00710 [Marseillevirus LCMAC103]
MVGFLFMMWLNDFVYYIGNGGVIVSVDERLASIGTRLELLEVLPQIFDLLNRTAA